MPQRPAPQRFAPVQPSRQGIDIEFFGGSTSIDADIASILSDTSGNRTASSQQGGVPVEALQALWNTEGAEELLDPSYGMGVSHNDFESVWAAQAADERAEMMAMSMSRTASGGGSMDDFQFDNDIDAELSSFRGPPRRESAYRVDRAPRRQEPVSRSEAQTLYEQRRAAAPEAPGYPNVGTIQGIRAQQEARFAQPEPRRSALERAAEYGNRQSAWSHIMDDDES